jgi:hypothetical protein
MAITPLKDNSKRERFLLMLFPAALILAVYSVVFAIPLRQEKIKNRGRVTALQCRQLFPRKPPGFQNNISKTKRKASKD